MPCAARDSQRLDRIGNAKASWTERGGWTLRVRDSIGDLARESNAMLLLGLTP
jgi:hypothetical protein